MENNFICNYCNIIDNVIILTPETKHYAKIVCAKCGKFFRWIQKPEKTDTNRKIKLNPSEISVLHGHKEIICFFCQRNKSQLGFNETMEVATF